MEWVESEPLSPAARVEAARAPRGCIRIQVSDLSADLAGLARRSAPNRGRVCDRPAASTDGSPSSTVTTSL